MSAEGSYERDTREVINRFLRHRIGFAECIAALDAALAKLIPQMPREYLPALRALLLANNETVMKEMEQAGATADQGLAINPPNTNYH
jgi:hypothetical protein